MIRGFECGELRAVYDSRRTETLSIQSGMRGGISLSFYKKMVTSDLEIAENEWGQERYSKDTDLPGYENYGLMDELQSLAL